MRLLVIALVLVPLLAACGESMPGKAARPDDAYSRGTHFEVMGSMPDGGVRGRTIHADGRYVSWAQEVDGGARRELRAFTVPASEVVAFFDALRQLDFLALETAHAAPAAGYASKMALHGPDGSHQCTWGQARDLPVELRKVAQTLARWEYERG